MRYKEDLVQNNPKAGEVTLCKDVDPPWMFVLLKTHEALPSLLLLLPMQFLFHKAILHYVS